LSRMAGYWRVAGDCAATLERMAAPLPGETTRAQSHCSPEFGVVCLDPIAAPDARRIACSEPSDVVVAVSGHLFGLDRKPHDRPAQHCLDLYLRYGDDLALHLSGTFTIAVCDRRDGVLRLITDRFNSRAFYCCEGGDGVLFANSLAAILSHPAVQTSVREEAVLQFLVIGQLMGRDTYYPNIHHLPPASVVRFGAATGSQQYWQPEFDADPTEPLEDSARRMADVIRTAIAAATTGDSRDGLMLSGGMDSRVIAAAASRPMACLTMHAVEAIELDLARQVAETLGHEHVFVRLDDDFPLGLLERGALVADGMHPFVHAQPLLTDGAVKELGLNRLFNGWGMDMYFAGMWMPSKRWGHGPAREEDVDVAGFFLEELEATPLTQLSDLVGPERANEARDGAASRLTARLDECRQHADNIHDAIALAIVRNFSRFPHYLNLKALSSVCAEAAPMHDVGLIEALLRTPYQHRFYARAYRRALQIIDARMTRIRYSGTGVCIYQNDYLQMAASYLQQKIARRAGKVWHALKGTPERMVKSAWPDMSRSMRDHPAWRATLREYTRTSWLVDHGMVSGDGLAAGVEAFIAGRSKRVGLLTNWLTLEAWFRHYG